MSQRLTLDEFIRRARKAHGDRYDYSLVKYEGQMKKVKIICPEHGVFEQEPLSHWNGCNCPYCMHRVRHTNESFIEKANKVHNGKYNYPNLKYTNLSCKIKVVCPKHGIFEIKAANHLSGKGCKKCRDEKMRKDRAFTTEQFIEQCKKIHNDYRFDYSKVQYVNNNTKVCIRCLTCGNEFWQTPSNHLQGQGCPHCKRSKGESQIASVLKHYNIDFVEQYRLPNTDLFCVNTKLYLDFYISKYNIGIEYQGTQHYMPVKHFGGEQTFWEQQQRDVALKDVCRERGIRLLEISYKDYKRIEEILRKELKIKTT